MANEYVTDVLEDAQVYSGHAGRKDIDADDVKLAIQTRLDHSFTIPPPRDFLLEIAKQKNNLPLPGVKPQNGVRLPPDRYCLTSTNYRLRHSQKRATLTLPTHLSAGKSSSVTFIARQGPTFGMKSTNKSSGAPKMSDSSSPGGSSKSPKMNIISMPSSSIPGEKRKREDEAD
ncbi:putative transcription initiation factor TFIID subunit 9 [Apostichopus japonicus]|uniref:Putative transcription initiation factor TFIID subunit 9 n=1 Tax=Stichopus japonicus TaxID=307972 RepID=A0A2G8KEV6_STIJA|nr:putative transcription initiation factor TFIID subunit 9 [Apostichopus japonicus]